LNLVKKDEKSPEVAKKSEEPVKKSYVDMKLASFDAGKKLALIKEIRTYLNLGLKEVFFKITYFRLKIWSKRHLV